MAARHGNEVTLISGAAPQPPLNSHSVNETPRERSWQAARDAERPKGEAHNFIQWKGTQVCMDLWCSCGGSSHLDADFAYNVRCPYCGQVWNMGWSVEMRPAAADCGVIQDALDDAGRDHALRSYEKSAGIR